MELYLIPLLHWIKKKSKNVVHLLEFGKEESFHAYNEASHGVALLREFSWWH